MKYYLVFKFFTNKCVEYMMFCILSPLPLNRIKSYGNRLTNLLMSEVHSADKLSVARDQ